MRTTVPLFTVFGLAATVPLSTFVKNSSVIGPKLTEVMSHGPLISPPDSVSTTLPSGFRTIRAPAVAVAEVPSVVGRLPTTT